MQATFKATLTISLMLGAATLLGGCDELFKVPGGDVVGGFYQGTLADATNGGSSALIAIVTEDGRAKIALGSSGNGGTLAIFDIPSLVPENGYFSAGYTLYGATVGVKPEYGTVSGNTAARRSISATFNANSPPDNGRISLSYNAQRYQQRASLAIVAGQYGFAYTNAKGMTAAARITIATDGRFSGNDTEGCRYGGQLKVPDTDYNAYAGSLTQRCGSHQATYDVLGSYLSAGITGGSSQLLLLGTDAANARAARFNLLR